MAASLPNRVRVLSVNDVYTLDNFPKLATFLREWKDAHGEPGQRTILTLNGDLIGGCLLFNLDKGTSVIDLCNELGFDYLCLGNHEFDHGVYELEQRVQEFKGCWLNSNVRVTDSTVGDTSAPLKPSVVNDMPRFKIETLPSGLRIGLLGVCSAESPALSLKDPTPEGVGFVNVEDTVAAILQNELKKGDVVDFVIALTHLSNVEDKHLLETFPDIDLILGGHDHIAWQHRVGDRLAVKCGMDCEKIAVLDYDVDGSTLRLVSEQLVDVLAYAADPCIAARVEEHKNILTLSDFALLAWSEYEDSLKAWAEKHDPAQADCWTTRQIRSRQVNFFSLISDFIKREMSPCPEETLFLSNSGQFRANVDYDFSRSLSFMDLKKELAFNNPLVTLVLPGKEIQTMITDSETNRRGQGGYLQYDCGNLVLEPDPPYRIRTIFGKPFSEVQKYTVILVCRMLAGMDCWENLIKIGRRLPNLQTIIDSSPRMCDVLTNALLKDKWKFLSTLYQHKDSPSGKKRVMSVDDLRQAATEESEMAVRMIFDLLDTNSDGMVDRDELALLHSPSPGNLREVLHCDVANTPTAADAKRAKVAQSSPGVGALDSMTWAFLEREDDLAVGAVIESLMHSDAAPAFALLAQAEGSALQERDRRDAAALKRGIEFAQAKGVLADLESVPPYTDLHVDGKTAGELADALLAQVGEANLEGGCIIALVGLSGTGKATTFAKLQERLSGSLNKAGTPVKAVTWANGLVFRCLTLLACEAADAEGISDWCASPETASSTVLTPENLQIWMKDRLRFVHNESGLSSAGIESPSVSRLWDIEVVRQDGSKVLASTISRTLLVEPRIQRSISTVAGQTQGEVVLFAQKACDALRRNGAVVLIEGREETVNFASTPFRFRLTISDIDLVGQRQAAHRVIEAALTDAYTSDCRAALVGVVQRLAAEHGSVKVV